MADGIFPKKDAEFNTYFGTVTPYLTANATRLNVSSGNVTALGTLKTSWDIKYPQSQDPNTATKTIIDEKTDLRLDIEDLLRSIYGDIPKSALTTADRNTLNLKERKPGAPRPQIETAPSVILQALGNLRVRLSFRVEDNESRPSIHPESDGLELKAMTGNTPPKGFNDSGLTSLISSKARFIHIFEDSQLAGQTFYIYARWINKTDAKKSGPWSLLAQVVIS